MSNINTNVQARCGFSLAAKLTWLVGGLGLLMTASFTILSGVQMHDEITTNYSHTLEAIVRVRESLLKQQYENVEELVTLIGESYIPHHPIAKQGGPLWAGEWQEPMPGSTPPGKFTADQDVARTFVGAEGRGAMLLQRLLEETPGDLPLGAFLAFLDKRSVVLAPAALRTQEMPVTIPAHVLAQASISRRAHMWYGEQGSYLYRVFYFAPQEWYVACFIPLFELEEVLARRMRQTLGMGVLLTLLGLVLAYWFSLRLTMSLSALEKAARMLPTLDMRSDILVENAEENAAVPLRGVWSGVIPGSLVPVLPALPVARGDEVGKLARTFECMVQQLQENVRNMLAVGKGQARVQSELQWARTILDGSLPREFPSHPALDVHGCVLPAREVGGDFFDVFMLDERYCCFTMGNVPDKGVPAALDVSMILSLTRSLVRLCPSSLLAQSESLGVAAVLMQVNAALCRENPRNMRVTMVLGVLDCTTGVIMWANAGHSAPLHLCPEDVPTDEAIAKDVATTGATAANAATNNVTESLRSVALCKKNHSKMKRMRVHALPTRQEEKLGGCAETEYSTLTWALNPGDRVLLYTNGVTEAVREDGERFGSPPEYIEGVPQNASALNWRMVKQIQMFVAGAPQSNDIALLNFQWRGPLE